MDHQTLNTWNKLASIYEHKFMDLDLYNETYDFICNSIIKKNAKLLEIGCGPGNITRYLLSKRPDFDIFGIDMAPNMIELAKKNNPTARFAIMDSREISQLEAKYDGIVSGFCIPYLSPTETEKFIEDSSDLLNKNGLIYISFMEGTAKQSGFKTSSAGDKVYFYYHELDQLMKQLTEAKFGEFKVFKVDYKRSETETEMHTIVMAKKAHG